MSDYLANLAARTLATPPLRPRVRMRFEPETAVDAPPPMIDAAPRSRVEAASPPQTHTPVTEKPPRVITVAPPPPPPPPAFSPPQRGEGARSADEGSPSSAADGDSEEKANTPHPPSGHLLPSRGGEKAGSEMPSEREVIERVETHTIERKLPHRYDDDPPRVTPVLPQPKIAQQPRLAAEPAREPDIQISIGRIEVRASTPPAPQHRGRGRAVMTIDDYVAKRDGKERR